MQLLQREIRHLRKIKPEIFSKSPGMNMVRLSGNIAVSILCRSSVTGNGNLLCCPGKWLHLSDWQTAGIILITQTVFYIVYLTCVAHTHTFPDVAHKVTLFADEVRAYFLCRWLCDVYSRSASRWCRLDAGHKDIFVAEVGRSHCMSMSPRVTTVWLLQEMTQASPSTPQTEREGGGEGDEEGRVILEGARLDVLG